MLKNKLMRYLREPLLHFVLIGAGVYLLYAAVGNENTDNERRVTVTAEEVAVIADQFVQAWNRPPTVEELNSLVSKHADVQVLYREALAMGLDKGDYVIERRLAQKLEFLAAGLTTPPEPGEQELVAYFRENLDRYRQPDTYTLTQVFFNSDNGRDKARAAAQAALAELRQLPDLPSNLETYGDASLLPGHLERRALSEIGREFGQAFSQQLPQLQAGDWHGPLLSGIGTHLVFIHEIVRADAPDFESLRARISDDWTAWKIDEFSRRFLDELRSRYVIVIENADIETVPAAREPSL